MNNGEVAGRWARNVLTLGLGAIAACGGEAPAEEAFEPSQWVEVTWRGHKTMAEIVDGTLIVEGDIVIGRYEEPETPDGISSTTQAVVIQDAGAPWPNGRVPFVFDATLSAAQRTAIQNAMNDWEANVPALTFVNDPSANDRIRFQLNANRCNSRVGRFGGEQIINLTAGCLGSASIHHEIAHALGFYHEHTRKDRGSFVQVTWGNIRGCPSTAQSNQICGCAAGLCGCPDQPNSPPTCDFSGNFTTDQQRSDVLEYDYGSVMHYGLTAFSWTGGQTLTALQTPPAGVVIGQRNAPSDLDYAKMRVAYPTLDLSTFVFSENGMQEICRLAGRELDVSTDYELFFWPESVSGNRAQTNGLGTDSVAVVCTARSAFFWSNYDYPNDSVVLPVSLLPSSVTDTFSVSVIVHTAPIALLPVLTI